MLFYAHTRPGKPQSEWELLSEHAQRVAETAERFCKYIAPGFGCALGYLHDAGKYQPAFQHYLRRNSSAYDEGSPSNCKEPHAAVGAAWADKHAGDARRLLAWPVAAHHGALKSKPDLARLIEQASSRLEAARQGGLDERILKANLPNAIPPWAQDRDAASLGVRMLLSALTDADMLESEAWDTGQERPFMYAPLADLLAALEKHLAAKQTVDAAMHGRCADLAALRTQVSEACVQAHTERPGRFRLTVPTGGGKTLSGLRFALHHAVHHGQERIIVVIPYTSILEQTVKVYRNVFQHVDRHAVIEHHCSLDPTDESQEHRWACENWDAPIIVTTSVQFLETLYADHKRRCRKLHRVANSVVLLDEVQTFPLELFDPIQNALNNLARYFRTSIVSMTATQPLLLQANEHEIIPDPPSLYAVTRGRFELEVLGDPEDPLEWDAIAERAGREERVLVIVHARKDAELLASMLGPDCVHLSARMCAAHRLKVIDTIKERLKQPGSCRVVATQLVEAGVDIDFPVVMRAFAGLETLAQAAGRCNREFAPNPGRFIVFRAPSQPPAASLRAGLNVALQFYREGRLDLNDPTIFSVYTRRVLQTRPSDPENVLGSERTLDFPASARNFRMIDSSGATVIVPYGDAWQRVQRLRNDPYTPLREGLRGLQRYTVTVYPQELRHLRAGGFLEPLLPVLDEMPESESNQMPWVIRGDLAPCPYSERFGLSWQSLEEEPSTLIA